MQALEGRRRASCAPASAASELRRGGARRRRPRHGPVLHAFEALPSYCRRVIGMDQYDNHLFLEARRRRAACPTAGPLRAERAEEEKRLSVMQQDPGRDLR